MGRKLKLTTEEQEHIREMYHTCDARTNIPYLGRLFRVSPTTITAVIDKTYGNKKLPFKVYK